MEYEYFYIDTAKLICVIGVLMANTMFTQKSSCLDAWKFGRREASKVDHPIHHLQFNSKIKYNRFSDLQKSLGSRLPNDSTPKMYGKSLTYCKYSI
ncbi:hypothetical protein CR513_43610, partial [Mucuna pruriens]